MNNDDNNNDNPPNNVLPFIKPQSKLFGTSPEQVNKSGEKPEPVTYRFHLITGETVDVTGFLIAGQNQIMMGDEDGMLLYLAPTDSISYVTRVDAETISE